jgi:hypothetical protein
MTAIAAGISTPRINEGAENHARSPPGILNESDLNAAGMTHLLIAGFTYLRQKELAKNS